MTTLQKLLTLRETNLFSMKMIAEKSGLTYGVLYRHISHQIEFDEKQGIAIVSAVREILSDMQKAVKEVLDGK